MKMRRKEAGSNDLVFEEIEPFFLDMLRRLPAFSDPGEDPAANARLYSAPMASGGDGDEFNEDWERFVEPEIRDLFRTARATVEADLAPLSGDMPPAAPPGTFNPADFTPTEHQLEIPQRHAEAWLSVLNQARLVIAARRGIGEREMSEDLPFPPLSERDMDLHRIDFYDFVQHILLREMGY